MVQVPPHQADKVFQDTSHQCEMPTTNLVILRVAGNGLIPDL